MALGVPIPAPSPSLRRLFSSPATPPTTLHYFRSTFRRKQSPFISLSLSGDSSSSLPSSASTGVLDSAGVKTTSHQIIRQDDLLIVGPGVLGRIVAEKWRKEHPDCQIFGQTMTADHHDELTKIGLIPSLRESRLTSKFSYVIFCAPPSRTPDYPGDVRLASLNWNGEGCFLFTSSIAVYDCNDNVLRMDKNLIPKQEVNIRYQIICSPSTDSPLVPIGRSPRVDVLLKAEKETLDVGGCVVRLAGLYKKDRGAHTFWLNKGTVDVRPDHMLNLIHYEDAASLSVAIMEKKLHGRVFLGCDNHPLTRQEIMDHVNQSGKFSKKFLGFTGTNDPLGKRMNNSKTRAGLRWEPNFTSFPLFLQQTD